MLNEKDKKIKISALQLFKFIYNSISHFPELPCRTLATSRNASPSGFDGRVSYFESMYECVVEKCATRMF